MMEIIQKGIVPYREAEELQNRLVARRLRGEIPDTVLLLEHPPVITMGRRDSRQDFRIPEAELRERGIEFYQTDRGGKLTFHGPGQLIGYFIFRLADRGVVAFVREIEEILIQFLAQTGLQGERDPRYPGVWAHQKKIASLGLHVEKGVTRHGFALNVCGDLTPFAYIVPCGIPDRGVTSVEKELGTPISFHGVKGEMEKIIRKSLSARRDFCEPESLPLAPDHPQAL